MRTPVAESTENRAANRPDRHRFRCSRRTGRRVVAALARSGPAGGHARGGPHPHAARGAALALALAAVACAGGPGAEGAEAANGGGSPSESASTADRGGDRPVVEVASGGTSPRFLDPDAEPSTDLGRLRARHLPVWTADFDWAFPPEACGTAWELDGIAEPTAGAEIAVLGDFATAAALTVMRYEHQFSRALAEPSALAQLCVATATVEPARSDDLAVLASYLAAGARRSEPAAHPEEVWIVAVGPTAAVSVACVTPGYPAVVGAGGETVAPAGAPARLQAYLLSVSRGLEDQVVDISYRVSGATHRPAEDCGDLSGWALEWDGHVQTWIAEGQIWTPLGAILTANAICDSPPPDGPDECPKDWPR